jgi:hypothetical protein
MAVSTNLLGRNVRCPHCKQVVQAPAGTRPSTPAAPIPAPAPPPPAPQLPKFNLPPKDPEHHESIFSERHDEDLFGSEPPKPQMPDASHMQRQAQRTMEILVTPVETPSVMHGSPPPNPGGQPATSRDVQPPFHHPVESPDLPTGPDPFAVSTEPPTQIRSRKSAIAEQSPGTVRTESGSNAFAWLLLTYAGLMTIAAGFFGYTYFTKSDTKESPFKAIPDVYGEYEKANRKQTSLNWLPDPKQPVPVDLRVKLGGELKVGDLLVKPISVEKQLLRCVTQYDLSNEKNRDVPPRTLVLTMKVKNLSDNIVFHPNDPAFNRAYDKHSTPRTFGQEKAPYTGLQVRNEVFHGIFPWPNESGVTKQYVVGHESDEKPLQPGEERDTWVTIAPAVDVLKTMPRVDPQESLLWRVQLRRGLVPYTDSDGSQKEISATSVIGVEFTMNDVK